MKKAIKAEKPKHQLVNNTLNGEGEGIIGRCTCGWTTGYSITSMIAANAFQDHIDAQK